MPRRIPAKKVMELLDAGLPAREISRSRGVAQQSVKLVRDSAEAAGLTWEAARSMTDDEVYRAVFPDRAGASKAFDEIDWEHVHSELQRHGVTLLLLWEEHRDLAAAKGLVPISYQTFCRRYRDHAASKKVTNHVDHKPGQAMEVDWSGTKMQLVDPFTGEVTKACLFVATLPYSQYSYVEATADMRQDAWLKCHIHAWDFFGGVAVRTVCDNLRTGVIEHPRRGEVVLNRSYEALGTHYGTAIMPTGVRKPKQKASVEGTVGKVATAIVARLRDRTFHTLDELNAAIREMLDRFNDQPFQKREGSRRSVFEDVERSFPSPLPKTPFEVCHWVYGRKVGLNFHVTFEKNHYSVPHERVGRKVDLRVGDTTVEVFEGGERIASHARLEPHVQYAHGTDRSHMPPEFAGIHEWDDARILGWARSIGPNTLAVVTRIFGSVDIKEQAYDPALAVPDPSRQYGTRRLEDACAYALERAQRPRCRFIRSVLASGVADGHADEGEGTAPGGFLRGPGYYGGGKGGQA